MKNYLCPECRSNTISGIGKALSSPLFPVTCKNCGSKLFLKLKVSQNIYLWLFYEILFVVSIAGFIIFRNILFIYGSVLLSLLVSYQLSRGAPLEKKNV